MRKFLMIALLALTAQSYAQTFTLKSKNLGGQATSQQVFNGFGCTGDNVSPQLYWENAPEGTKSFAITIYDKDAPTGSGWWHWLVFNLDKNTTELKEGAGSTKPKLFPKNAIQSLTDFGKPGYGGPCPPEGDGIHSYEVTVYALNTDKLDLEATANPALVGFMINAHTIEKASLVFYFKR